MGKKNLDEKWALVTGASSGLGADFARILAEKGCHLILVARREDRLRELKQEIEQKTASRIEIRIFALDLAVVGAPQTLFDKVRAAGLFVDILINNAGFGVYGRFLDIPWERELQMLQLDITSVVHLTKLFVRDMVARGFGHILQVGSIGAYQPTPTYASYSATKAFVLNFSEAVNFELRNTPVRITVLSPGFTLTEFTDVSGQRRTWYQQITKMASRPVAEIGIRAMLAGRASVVAGLLNAITMWFVRFWPRSVITAIAYLAMREPVLPVSER